MLAGETTTVLGGTYNERVRVTRSGGAGAPISFLASGTVIMQGFTVQARYIAIRGFEITNTRNDFADGLGIYLEGGHCALEDDYVHFVTRGRILLTSQSDTCTVHNNRLYRNSQWEIQTMGQDHVVEGNEISGTIQYHPNWENPPDPPRPQP